METGLSHSPMYPPQRLKQHLWHRVDAQQCVELSHVNALCVSDETEEKGGVVGIEKVERNRNWEMWDNSEKHGQRKKRTNADKYHLLFTTLTKEAHK